MRGQCTHNRTVSESFDRAQVCANGHVVNPMAHAAPNRNAAFCPACGAASVSECSDCHAPIRGQIPGRLYVRWTPPGHCHSCGARYPWTEARVTALALLVDLADLPDERKSAMKARIPDLVVATPMTRVAAAHMRAFLRAAGELYTKAVEDALREAGCEVAKAALGLSPEADSPQKRSSSR